MFRRDVVDGDAQTARIVPSWNHDMKSRGSFGGGYRIALCTRFTASLASSHSLNSTNPTRVSATSVEPLVYTIL
jgi:hypothetical protein